MPEPTADTPSSPGSTRVPLVYPFEEPPQRGQSLQVLPGVFWVRMPLPYALDHINLWVLDDGEGWAIVDTGTRTDEVAAVWRDLFARRPTAAACRACSSPTCTPTTSAWPAG